MRVLLSQEDEQSIRDEAMTYGLELTDDELVGIIDKLIENLERVYKNPNLLFMCLQHVYCERIGDGNAILKKVETRDISEVSEHGNCTKGGIEDGAVEKSHDSDIETTERHYDDGRNFLSRMCDEVSLQYNATSKPMRNTRNVTNQKGL